MISLQQVAICSWGGERATWIKIGSGGVAWGRAEGIASRMQWEISAGASKSDTPLESENPRTSDPFQ
jgi:hypothetical protein